MNILVTGGEGFIGSVLVRKLQEQGHKVYVYDIVNGDDIVIDPGIAFAKLNPADYDMVFHLASGISVQESIEKAKNYFDTILYGTYRLLEHFKGKRFVYISSNSAKETNTPYGLFKRIAERTVELYPNTISLRPYHVFGEGEHHRIIYQWSQLMLANEDIFIFGDGSMQRDYTYVEDVADAMIDYGIGAYSLYKGVYELGYGKGTTVIELFRIMADFFGYKKEPKYKYKRPGDAEISISIQSIRGIGFEAGLKKTMEHYKKEYAEKNIHPDAV